MTNAELSIKVTAIEGKCDSNSGRILKLEERQENLDKLVTSVALLAKAQEGMQEDIRVVKADVKALVEKPSKKWDKFTEIVFKLIVTAILGYIFVKIGLT